ncbi:Dabb family protein [Candidatus Neomarinimicrobiota bacterium]
MIKHIVMWRMKHNEAEHEQEQQLFSMKERLESLPQAIPQIRHFEIGLNVNPSERAMDIVLYSEFDSREDLSSYVEHPAHQAAASYIRTITSEVRIVDYEA